MGNWFHDLGLFFFAVIDHWQALATGGIVTAIIFAVEKKMNKSLSWKSYVIFFVTFALYSFFAAWQDEHRNTSTVVADKASYAAALGNCQINARLEQAYVRGLEASALSTRATIDREQRLNDKQSNDISGCLISLGKMNPKIREEIDVLVFPYGQTDNKGRFVGSYALMKKYRFIMLITTNETELRFHGNVSCDRAFDITTTPRVPGTSQTTMVLSASPNKISDTEFEISASVEGSDWSPAHPAIMFVSSDDQSLGSCKFSPRS